MATKIPFRREMEFEYGVVRQVSPMVRRIVARNPSPFTFHGTNTYLIGHDRIAIVDPGPDLREHIDAILGAVGDDTVTHLLITHTHHDHSPAAAAVQRVVGGRTCGYGPHGGDRPTEHDPATEAADYAFRPDISLRDGDVVQGRGGWTVNAFHTPGHTSNHMSYGLFEERALFSGDHVMGWSTSVVSPPDGHMGDYMQSLGRCLARDDALYWPGHGPPIPDPRPFVQAFIAHREEREAQIMACLEEGVTTIPAIVERLYADVPHVLHRAAGRSVRAHLERMVADGRALMVDLPGREPNFRRR
ncbi:MAG: MBL fold metallo-hydrolase [Alphaproteobacteria bacterium]|nr:MBL fold metallo-hydrolase [Alphaproteobacteria bacterium]